MKAVFNSVLLIAVVVTAKPMTEQQKQIFRGYIDKCLMETNVDKSVVEKAHQGHFEDDDNLPSFFLCMSKKIGFRDSNNVFQPNAIKEKLSYVLDDAAMIDKISNMCFIEKSTPEESAIEAFKCYQENTSNQSTFY